MDVELAAFLVVALARSSWILLAVAAVALWIAFRVRWWQRVHYQSLWGRSFPPAEVKRRLLNLAIDLDRVLSAAQIPYWLDWGTLLGAYRDGGFIPWDDDFDVSIRHEDHERVYALRQAFSPPYRMVLISEFWSVDKVIPGLKWLRPCRTFLRLLDPETKLYVDIFEVGDVGGGKRRMLPLSLMHDPKDARGQALVFDQSEVFPLSQLAFEGRSFPVPRQTEAYLHRLFGSDLSPDRVLDERTGKYIKKRRTSAPQGTVASAE
jgi:LicD family protein